LKGKAERFVKVLSLRIVELTIFRKSRLSKEGGNTVKANQSLETDRPAALLNSLRAGVRRSGLNGLPLPMVWRPEQRQSPAEIAKLNSFPLSI
jgi:hypothetical protein